MIIAKLSNDEKERFVEIQQLNILGSPPDLRIDCITQYIANAFKLSHSAVAIIDSKYLWFKSLHGKHIPRIPRCETVCGHALYEVIYNHPLQRLFAVSNLTLDKRFHDCPLVVNEPKARSYLGFVLQSESGKNIGTFFAMDTKPREFSKDDRLTFIAAALMIENIILDRHHYHGLENGVLNRSNFH